MRDFIIDHWLDLLIVCISAMPTIILFTIKGRITHWFNKDLETHKTQLDRKSRQIQSSFDTQLEVMRIEFGLIQTERLQILKEACIRITEILNQINIIASFNSYDCKENVDYKNKCISNSENCMDDCIINYWDKIVHFDKYTCETYDFFKNNQMFFPLEVVNKHLEIIGMLFNLRKEAYDISYDKKESEKDQALKCFELFYNFDKKKINELQSELMNEYRFLIGVSPLKSLPIYEYRLLNSQLKEK